MKTNLKQLPGCTEILLTVHDLLGETESIESIEMTVQIVKRSQMSLDDQMNAVSNLYKIKELIELSQTYCDELDQLEPMFYKEFIES